MFDGNGQIGTLDWDDCKDCKSYRPDAGGCDYLDRLGDSILYIDFITDSVKCEKYEEKKENE